jgi:RsiW-degrading membrane proteinase PrsW (M82 family)
MGKYKFIPKWYLVVALLLGAGILGWILYPITAFIFVTAMMTSENFLLSVLISYLFWLLLLILTTLYMKKKGHFS